MREASTLVILLLLASCSGRDRDAATADPSSDGSDTEAASSDPERVDDASVPVGGEGADSERRTASESTPLAPAAQPAGGADEAAPNGADEADAPNDALSFEADIWPIFTMPRQPEFVYRGAGSYGSCVVGGVCHGGASPGAGLSMPDAASAYAALLDAPSRSGLCAGTTRVVPGDPEQSCLVLFYEGRLRDELGWVDQAEIDLVRAWIAQGALP